MSQVQDFLCDIVVDGLRWRDGVGPLPIPRAQRSANCPSRLPSHTACAILRPEMTHKSLT